MAVVIATGVNLQGRREVLGLNVIPTDVWRAYGPRRSPSALRDSENVPLKEDINVYFSREVFPHVPERKRRLSAAAGGTLLTVW